jgi:hypothetical protein
VKLAGRKQSRLRPWLLLAAAILVVIVAALLMGRPPFSTCGLLSAFEPADPSAFWNLRDHCKPQAYVAHAFGEIDGIFYTDSRDAFQSNYDKGFRTFEVDLVLLQDGSAFCAHDGSEWMYGMEKPFAETTAAELSGRLCLGKYTPLTGSDLLDLINEHPDAYFILDTKRTNQGSNHKILRSLVSEAKKTHPSALDRMIPHTFGPADLWGAAGIYPFRHYWVAVYTIRCNIDRSSGPEADRIVLYAISNGGPAALRRKPAITGTSASPCVSPLAALSALRCLALGVMPSLCDSRLYVSVDIIDGNPTTPSP